MIVQVFVAPCHGHLGVEGVFYEHTDAGVIRACLTGAKRGRQLIVDALMVVVQLRLQRQFCGGIVGQHGIRQIVPRTVIPDPGEIPGTGQIGFGEGDLLGRIPG